MYNYKCTFLLSAIISGLKVGTEVIICIVVITSLVPTFILKKMLF